MTDLIQQFVDFWEDYHHVSRERRVDRLKYLRALEASMGSRSMDTLTARDLESFLGTLDLHPATIQKIIRYISPFVNWMWKHEMITADQYMRLKEVRPPRGISYEPRPYTRKEIGEFWEYLEHDYPFTRDREMHLRTSARAEFWTRRFQRGESEWKRVRPYAQRLQVEAVVALAMWGGLRRIEIFNLPLEDVDYNNKHLRVRTAKVDGEQSRLVPVNDQMGIALGNWIEFRAQVLQPEHNRLWVSLSKNSGAGYLAPMSLRAFGRLLANIGPGYELHRLRHTFATERLKNGMRVERLQVAMGHSQVSRTLQYAKISDEEVLEDAEATNERFVAALDRRHVMAF